MIIAQTPLRLSFFGGGTDFPSYYASPANAHGGSVVGVSIDKYIYVIVKERFD
jgi:D-glycero-alpha-D-manno-heptose-7-phosphate kinase